MTLLPAILLAGLFGGIQVGLAVAVVCALVGWLMYLPSYGTLVLSVSHVVTLTIFVATAALQLYVIRV